VSRRHLDTPGPLEPPVAQRDLELEVAKCVGGVLSPLLANIALSVLDEHLHGPWLPGGAQSTQVKRAGRRKKGLLRWRLVRYADDFVVLVHGNENDAQALREDVARVLATMGLRLTEAKTQVTHLDRGFDFLGFRIQRRRKRGTNKWYVYTFVADRAIRAVKAKIRAMTPRETHQDRPGRTRPRLRGLLHPADGNTNQLAAWITTARSADLPHLHAFTRGLDLDHAAVDAALTLPHHNGGAEGVNTKTKQIMRQMHGRAGFPPSATASSSANTQSPPKVHQSRVSDSPVHTAEPGPGPPWGMGRRRDAPSPG